MATAEAEYLLAVDMAIVSYLENIRKASAQYVNRHYDSETLTDKEVQKLVRISQKLSKVFLEAAKL